LEQIQVHFHEQHHAYAHPFCVSQGFIVYDSQLELQLHMAEIKVGIAIKSVEEPVEDPRELMRKQRHQAIMCCLGVRANEVFSRDQRAGRNLFADTVASIAHPRARAEVVSIHDGYTALRKKTMADRDFPVFQTL
jgi:hypothetical protein